MVTIGVSDVFNQELGESGIELLFAWLPLSTHASFKSLQDLVFDAAAYCNDNKVREQGTVLVPERKPRSLLAERLMVDEPLTEADSVKSITLGRSHVHLFWLVPVFEREVQFIAEQGIEAFDKFREGSRQNLFRLDREPIIHS